MSKEYVASIIGLYYKNNGAVSCVGIIISPLSSNFTLSELRLLLLQAVLGISHRVTFELIPN